MRKIYGTIAFIVCLAIIFSDVAAGQGFVLSFQRKPTTIEEWQKQALDAMILVTENDLLQLLINEDTTEIAVKVKNTGYYWFSNPVDRDQGQDLIFEEQSAQFTVYHDPNKKEKENYRFGIKYNQFNLMPIENGIRVNYEIVEEWGIPEYAPRLISHGRLQEILAEVPKATDVTFVKNQFELVALRLVEEDEMIRLSGLNNEALFNGYSLFPLDDAYAKSEAQRDELKHELEDLRAQSTNADPAAIEALEQKLAVANNKLFDRRRDLIWHLLNTVLRNRKDIERIEDIRFDDIKQLVENPTYLLKDIPRFQLEDMVNILRATGYTPHDVANDHAQNNLNPTIPHLEEFFIPMEYYLDGDSLVVRIPVDEIIYPTDVLDVIGGKHTYPITDIDVLKYFGAGNQEQDGYIFIPDGCGAVIDFNNGKDFATFYRQKVYGPDLSNQSSSGSSLYETIPLPVFGIKAGDGNAFLAIIESGDAMATITADIARKSRTYNTVFASFKILPSEKLDLGRTSISKYQGRFTDEDIVIRYAFLTDDQANYAGMAQRYQTYLQDTTVFAPLAEASHMPLYLDILAAAPIDRPILGFPRTVTEVLTTFAQTQEIVSRLLENQVANIHLKLSGWSKGGLGQSFAKNLNLEKKLGTEADFHHLVEFLGENLVGFYPEISVAKSWLNDSDFHSAKEAARTLGGKIAKIDRRSAIVSPFIYQQAVNGVAADLAKANIGGLALMDLGKSIYSDFDDDNDRLIDRQQSKSIIEGVFASLTDEQNLSLLSDQAFAHALPYVDHIINAPLYSNEFNITKQTVPFYQMVVHGFVNYTGPPINLNPSRREMLRLIEYGAYPLFTLSFNDASELKHSYYNDLYSVSYKNWLDTAVDIYHEFSLLYTDIGGQKMILHEELMDNVYLTLYKNGVGIIVNYNLYSIDYRGQIINGESYLKIKGLDDYEQ